MEWNQCYYCGKTLKKHEITMDHVEPKAFGGEKMVTACKCCNNAKGCETLEWFRKFLGVVLFYGEQMGWLPW